MVQPIPYLEKMSILQVLCDKDMIILYCYKLFLHTYDEGSLEIRQREHTTQKTKHNEHMDIVGKGHHNIHDELECGCDHNHITPPDSTKQAIVIIQTRTNDS